MTSQAAIAASTSQLAMGRIVGSLCVVTARDEDAASAMLVRGAPLRRLSWVGLSAVRLCVPAHPTRPCTRP
jgi:hypothetical protein